MRSLLVVLLVGVVWAQQQQQQDFWYGPPEVIEALERADVQLDSVFNGVSAPVSELLAQLNSNREELGLRARQVSRKPMVLVLGAFSSGKSTIINSLLGGQVLATGEAPTTDRFEFIVGNANMKKLDRRLLPYNAGRERDEQSLLGPAYVERKDGSPESSPVFRLPQYSDLASIANFAGATKLIQANCSFCRVVDFVDSPGLITATHRAYSFAAVAEALADKAALILFAWRIYDPGNAVEAREVLGQLWDKHQGKLLILLTRINELRSLQDVSLIDQQLGANMQRLIGNVDMPVQKILRPYFPDFRQPHARPWIPFQHTVQDAERVIEAIANLPGQHSFRQAEQLEHDWLSLLLLRTALVGWCSARVRRQRECDTTAGLLLVVAAVAAALALLAASPAARRRWRLWLPALLGLLLVAAVFFAESQHCRNARDLVAAFARFPLSDRVFVHCFRHLFDARGHLDPRLEQAWPDAMADLHTIARRFAVDPDAPAAAFDDAVADLCRQPFVRSVDDIKLEHERVHKRLDAVLQQLMANVQPISVTINDLPVDVATVDPLLIVLVVVVLLAGVAFVCLPRKTKRQ